MNRSVAAALAAAALWVACDPAGAAPESDSGDVVVTAASSAPAPLDTAQRREQFLAGLHKRTGLIDLPGAGARLNLGQKYYFLDPADSKKVLVDAWRNPRDAADGVLGMVFPADQTPLDEQGWGAVITYLDSGYVSDKDARTTDYAKVLDQLRQGEDQDNEERKKQNFPSIHLIGWGQQPSYDAVRHSLIWARELQFGEERDHTLNYDVRVLGRKGVLSLNIVATMSQLPQIRTAANDLQATATFTPGSGYADYKQGVDKRAAYGLAGLILAGAGLAVVKKAGLIAVALLFLKKGFAVVIAAVAGGWAWLRRKLGGRKAAS
jgi:uncharacterized membrane-anchored protein